MHDSHDATFEHSSLWFCAFRIMLNIHHGTCSKGILSIKLEDTLTSVFKYKDGYMFMYLKKSKENVHQFCIIAN